MRGQTCPNDGESPIIKGVARQIDTLFSARYSPRTKEIMTTSATTTAKKPGGGLEGVVATQSSICFIDGRAGRLVYRGYDIDKLVGNVSFEETAYLLWNGELPNKTQLDALRAELLKDGTLPDYTLQILRALPKTTQPMDALRTAASSLSSSDPDLNSRTHNLQRAVRLTALFPLIVTAFHRIRNGLEPVAPDPKLSIAANFLYTLTGKAPHDTLVKVMDGALVLHAEHGMNASTFAARVTAATLADMYAAVTAALGALKGPLHGGANEEVMKMLLEGGSVDKVESMVKAKLANKEKIPGFGHRVYRTFDPRATFLRKMSKQLGDAAGEAKWYQISERLIPIMRDTPKSDGTPMDLNPNVDFFSASAYYTMGIPLDLFTPIFAIARITGWTAHVMEQQADNRIIRPTDEYTGPMDREVTPIDQRA